MFFMLSGRFNIRILGEGEWGRYYVKKIRGVFVPTLVFLLIYTAKDLYPGYGGILHFCKVYVLNSLGAMSHGIFWFVFSLFGMLTVAPFFAKALKSPSRDYQNAFFIVWLIWAVMCHCSDNLGIDFNWSYPLQGYFFFFCLGAFVEDSSLNMLETKKLVAVGCVAWLANSAVKYYGWSRGTFDMSPLFTITAVCLYLLLLRVNFDMVPHLKNVCSLLSKHSFGIYLAHWLSYEFLQRYFVTLLNKSGVLYQLLLSPAVLLSGVLLAVFIDKTVIMVAQHVFDRLVRHFVDSEANYAN